MAETLAETDVSDRCPVCTDLIHFLYGTVGAAVVNEEYLHVPALQLGCGGLQAFDECQEVVGLIVHRNDDGETSFPRGVIGSDLFHKRSLATGQLPPS